MNHFSKVIYSAGILLGGILVGSPSTANAQVTATPENATAEKGASEKGKDSSQWRSLSGKWKPCEFGGDGEITIKDGTIKLDYGDPITGVVWDGPLEGDKDIKATDKDSVLPRDNYEIRWECRRDKGFDFLCAFTFPIGKKHASFVMGGWGGGVTGISSIDGQDASDNNTTMFQAFDNDQWYKARVRVDAKKITVWVDGKELFDHPRDGHEFDIRFEMDPCLPLGIANFECESRIRNIEMRRLSKEEIPK